MIDRMSETRKIGYKEVVLGRQGKLFFPLVVVDNTAGVPQVKDLWGYRKDLGYKRFAS